MSRRLHRLGLALLLGALASGACHPIRQTNDLVGEHTCALLASGGVRCWGFGYNGQLGDGSGFDRSTPVAVVGLPAAAVGVATGDWFTCVTLDDGRVTCWGRNRHGQLGDGTTTRRLGPVEVGGVSGAVEVAGGGRHACARLGNGGVRCWGANERGQLGDGTTAPRPASVEVAGLAGVTALATGPDHACAVVAAGEVRCWGANDSGQLGDGTIADRSSPVAVAGLPGAATAIAVAAGRSCVLLDAGAVECWGSPAGVPTGLPPVVAIVMGQDFGCVLTAAGGVRCWGMDRHGQRGDGGELDWHYQWIATPVVGLESGVVALAAGGSHACALRSDATARCWGSGHAGQLGDGTGSDAASPVPVAGLDGAVALAAGAGIDEGERPFECGQPSIDPD